MVFGQGPRLAGRQAAATPWRSRTGGAALQLLSGHALRAHRIQCRRGCLTQQWQHYSHWLHDTAARGLRVSRRVVAFVDVARGERATCQVYCTLSQHAVPLPYISKKLNNSYFLFFIQNNTAFYTKKNTLLIHDVNLY